MTDKASKDRETQDMMSSLSHSLRRSWPSDKNVLQSAAAEADGRSMDAQQQEMRSMSGLLRKASMLCKPGGGVDPSHKALMKSLVLNNDEAIVAALDSSEAGDVGDLNKYLRLLSIDHNTLTSEQRETLARERGAMVDQWQRNIKTLARRIVKKEEPKMNAQSEFERRRMEQGMGSKRSRPGSMRALTNFRDPLRLRTVTEKSDEDSDDDEPVTTLDVGPARLASKKIGSGSQTQQQQGLSPFQLNAPKQTSSSMPPPPVPLHKNLHSSGSSTGSSGNDSNGTPQISNDSMILAKLLQLQKSVPQQQQQQQQQRMNGSGLAALGNLAAAASSTPPPSGTTSPTGSSSGASAGGGSSGNNNMFNVILLLQQQQEALQEKQQKEFAQLLRTLQESNAEPQVMMQLIELTKRSHEQEMREMKERIMSLLQSSGMNGPSIATQQQQHHQAMRSQQQQHNSPIPSPDASKLSSSFFNNAASNVNSSGNNIFGGNNASAAHALAGNSGLSLSDLSALLASGNGNSGNGHGGGMNSSGFGSSAQSPSGTSSPATLSSLLSRYAAGGQSQTSASIGGGLGGSMASGSAGSSGLNSLSGGDLPSGSVFSRFGLGGSSVPGVGNGSANNSDQQRMILQRLLAEQQQQHHHQQQQQQQTAHFSHNDMGHADRSGMMPPSSAFGGSIGTRGFNPGNQAGASTTGSPVADLVLSRQREREVRKQLKLEVRREKKSSRERQRRLVLNTKYDELCTLLFDPVERESKDRASVLQTAINFLHDTEGIPVPDRVPGEDEMEDDDEEEVALPAGPNLTADEKLLRRRLKKSRREKQRRHNVNILSERLGTMLNVPEVKEKSMVLQTAIERIAEKKGINLSSQLPA